MLTGRNSWAKTRRNGEDALMIAPTTSAALRTIDLVDPSVLEQLVLDLEGDDAALAEIVSQFALIWPRRLGQLRTAVAGEQLEAMQDAIASIRVSAAMLGAPRLRVAAEEFTELLAEADRQPEAVGVGAGASGSARSAAGRLSSAAAAAVPVTTSTVVVSAAHLGVDIDACRRSVAEIARVGADTVVEIRARYLDVETRARH